MIDPDSIADPLSSRVGLSTGQPARLWCGPAGRNRPAQARQDGEVMIVLYNDLDHDLGWYVWVGQFAFGPYNTRRLARAAARARLGLKA